MVQAGPAGISAERTLRQAMDLQLTDQIAVVVGAERGIGRVVGETFAAEGCDVGLIDCNPEVEGVAGEIARQSGRDCAAVVADVAVEEAMNKAAAELVEGDARDLDYEDASFDAVASIQALEYIEDVDRVLVEARRVIKPGGRAALISVLWDHWR